MKTRKYNNTPLVLAGALLVSGLATASGCDSNNEPAKQGVSEPVEVEVRDADSPEEAERAASKQLNELFNNLNSQRYGAVNLSAAEKAKFEPGLPKERFEYLGLIDEMPKSKIPQAVSRLLQEGLFVGKHPEKSAQIEPQVADAAQEEQEKHAKAGADDEYGDLQIVVYADGRVFKEIPGTRPEFGKKGILEASASEKGDGEGKDSTEDQGVEFRKWVGGDGRSLQTGSNYPWSAITRLESYCVGCVNEPNPAPTCSGTFVGPRHVLTAAHCMDNGWRTNSPAGRGGSYGGNKYPWGRRAMVGVAIPQGWSGGGPKYDYATVILDDINWFPGYFGFGTASAGALDWDHINSAGYPGRLQTCNAAPIGSACDGFMYRQYESTRAVGLWTIYHSHDTNPGNSGMSLYDYINGSRIVRGVHKGPAVTGNRAHRIRSGSYGSICSAITNNPSSFQAYPGC